MQISQLNVKSSFNNHQSYENIDENESQHSTLDCRTFESEAIENNVDTPVATAEDDNENDATINKWSELRIKSLSENKYFLCVVTYIILIASISLGIPSI